MIGEGTLIEEPPTGGTYALASTRETPVEELPQVDTAQLVAAVEAAIAELAETTQATRPTLNVQLGHAALIEYLWAALPAQHRATRLFHTRLDEPLLAVTPYTLEPFVGVGALHTSAIGAIAVVDAPIAHDEAVPTTEEEAPPAFHAFKDLGRWLDADDGEVAQMVGFGRTTPYAWKRAGTEPRVGTVRRLYEYHATLDSLQRRLGEDGLRRWLHLGAPATRRETLLAGALEQLEREVHEVLFRRAPQTRIDLASGPEDVGDIGTREGQAPRASRRRPRRPKA